MALGSGVVLALALYTAAPGQESEPPDSGALPDHVILTNAKVGGSPEKQEAAPKPSIDSLLRGAQPPTEDEIRAAIRADAARDPRFAELYRDLLDPNQSFRIVNDGQGSSTIFYLTPDRRPVIIRPDE